MVVWWNDWSDKMCDVSGVITWTWRALVSVESGFKWLQGLGTNMPQLLGIRWEHTVHRVKPVSLG